MIGDFDGRPKQARGFAVIDPALRREIARKGGQAAQAKGTGHRFTREGAKVAAKRGWVLRRAARQIEVEG